MELRLSDEEKEKLGLNNDNQSSGGLRLAGQTTVSDEARDPGRNPWDYDMEDKVIKTQSITRSIDLQESVIQNTKRDHIVVTISMYIFYVLFILEVASMAWICTQHPMEVYSNLLKFQLFYSVCSFVMLIDLIIVEVFVGLKVSLIIMMLFFPFLYPWRRSKYTEKGETLGAVCTVGYVFALIGMIVFLFNAVSQYGAMITIQDETTRNEIVKLMDQVDDQGNRYGDMISDDIFIGEAAYEQTSGTEGLVISGSGTVTLENDVFVTTMGSDVSTQLIFIKTEEGTYEITGVILGGVTLNEYGAKSYWEAVIQ